MRENPIHSGMKYQIPHAGSSENFSELAEVPKNPTSAVKIRGGQVDGGKQKSVYLKRRFSFFGADRYNSTFKSLVLQHIPLNMFFIERYLVTND